MSAVAVPELITPEEFLALPNLEEDLLEFDDGRVVEVQNMSFDHGVLQGWLCTLVNNWATETGAQVGAATNPCFWITDRQMRKPDLAILRHDALAAMPEFRGGLRGCPEVAVEVISGNERVGEVERKTKLYLDSGAKAVWNLYPESETIVVWHPGGGVSILGPTGFLEDPDLLPGLRIPVGELFARSRRR
jgi:Uma2 family endonuclease